MQFSNNRLWLLSLAGVALFGIIIFRLADLQIFRASYFQAVAASQRQRAAELAPHRGTIYLQESKSGELFPVGVNQKAHIAYSVPRDIEDPQALAEQLAPGILAYRQRQKARVEDVLSQTGQLNQPDPGDSEDNNQPEQLSLDDQLSIIKQELYRKFDQRSDPYEPFLRFYEVLDDELLAFFEANPHPGVIIEEQEVRTYPENSLATHALGYVGYQDDQKVGRYGIEGYFEQQLAGSLGFISTEQDITGRSIGLDSRQFDPAVDGTDIVLTVDRVVQSIIEEELADGIDRYGATRGSIIVMEPSTGAVLGMATFPTFNPNYYYAINDARVQLNPSISEIFEPGSILKPLIMASALAEDKVKPDTTFVDSGPVRVAEYTIDTFDGQHRGIQTMTQVLEQSNNVGMVWVGQQLGAETMYDYLRRFGIGEKTGIELEGETQSNLSEPDDWNVTTVATTSFGQGVAVTPLQAINSINSLANGGTLMQPHIVSLLRDPEGNETITTPTAVRRVVEADVSHQISAMLVSVIENGVATLARVPGYYMAGKTGTAQVPDETGAYSKDRKIISFVGYGPVSKPKFSIIIKLDDPAGLSFASGTAAPMFRHISEKLLNYYQIPPDYDPSSGVGDFVSPSQADDRGV